MRGTKERDTCISSIFSLLRDIDTSIEDVELS